MVRINATDWTSFPGETATLSFRGRLGSSPSLLVGDTSSSAAADTKGWQAELAAGEPGERVVTLRYGDRLTTRAVLNTVPDLRSTIAARTQFIAGRQQWHKAGDRWDGAIIAGKVGHPREG